MKDDEKGEEKEKGKGKAKLGPYDMLQVVREEIRRSLSLLEEGSQAAAAVRLTQLRWDLDSFLGNKEATPWTWVRVRR